MGSDFGALLINPANFGAGPFSTIGTVTGKVLASSNNGNLGIFSDTLHTPNQVYVVNATSTSSQSATPLNIPQAVAAAFSPDGLKAFIFGNGGSSLYVYSTLQALQGPIALAGPANANTVAFSPNGAFAYVAEAAANGGTANLTAFNTCNNQIAASPAPTPTPAVVKLSADPLFMRVLSGLHLEGTDSFGNPIPDGTHVLVLDATGFDILTSTISPPAPGTLCPQTVSFSNPQRIELAQGKLQPINFFPSADGTQLYVVAAGHASILVYDFSVGAVTSGIELLGNATPISADISPDAGTIIVAGSDGVLHEVSTGLGGSDQFQLSFPNIPDYLNPFCAITSPQNPCSLNLVVARP
jgi:DNA-binding beta-propeller fold protein YncE